MALNKAFRAFSAVLLLILLPAMPVAAQAVLIPSSPQIAASSYILMDPLSGRIIMEENSHERLPPASLTKMMTAYIAEEELQKGNISEKDMAPISVQAWQMGCLLYTSPSPRDS